MKYKILYYGEEWIFEYFSGSFDRLENYAINNSNAKAIIVKENKTIVVKLTDIVSSLRHAKCVL